MQTIGEMIVRFPKLAAIVDDRWLRRPAPWLVRVVYHASAPWYEQLEHDLGILEKHVNGQQLIACYRKDLRNQDQFIQTCYEIHGAALLARPATAVHLHVLREEGSEKNFDIRVEIRGRVVNADAKTRTDKLSFLHRPQRENEPQQEDEDEVISNFGSRAIIDPHDAGELGLPVDSPAPGEYREPIPESTRIRQIFLDCLSQLPDSGCNLIIFGQIEGDRSHLERALYGAEYGELLRHHQTKALSFRWRLAPVGAFATGEKGEPFRSLSGVLWMRLYHLYQLEGTMQRAYKLYLNPNASLPLPSDVIESLDAIMQEWATWSENGDPPADA
jgi:hypothetical protein